MLNLVASDKAGDGFHGRDRPAQVGVVALMKVMV
jgi:hypothetical protein